MFCSRKVISYSGKAESECRAKLTHSSGPFAGIAQDLGPGRPAEDERIDPEQSTSPLLLTSSHGEGPVTTARGVREVTLIRLCPIHGLSSPASDCGTLISLLVSGLGQC